MPIFLPTATAQSNFRAFVVKISQSSPLAPTPSRVGNVVAIGQAASASKQVIPPPLFISGTPEIDLINAGYSYDASWILEDLTQLDLWPLQGKEAILTNNPQLAIGFVPATPANSILTPLRIVKDAAEPSSVSSMIDYAELATFESYLYVLAVANQEELHQVLSYLYQNIDNYSVIVLTHAVSQLFLAATALPEPTLTTMLCIADETLAPKNLQLNAHIGLFLDNAFDGKVVMAITAMAQRYNDKPTATNSITNPSYNGITDTNIAELLGKEMYSFWIKSHQKTYPFALFAGGRQLYTILYEMYAIEAVMDAIANLTNQGNTLAQNLELMPATILAAISRFLPLLSGSPSIRVAAIDNISQSDMVQGIINIEDIQFGFSGEHRQTRVHISAS